MNKRISVIVCVAGLFFLLGTMFSSMAFASTTPKGTPFAAIWEFLFGLEARVDAIEENGDLKEWHYVDEVTFNESSVDLEKTINIEGNKWRIIWSFEKVSGGIRISDNVRIYDEEDNFIDGFQLADKQGEKGIFYIPQGHGNYKVKIDGLSPVDSIPLIFTFSMTIESYH